MKKIGLITWNGSYNYGTNLQAFALYKFIKKNGNQIDFIVPEVPAVAKNNIYYTFKFLFLKCMMFVGFKRRTRLAQYLRLRNFVHANFNYVCWYSLSESNKLSYDLLLSGSDQIWNPNNLETFNLLDFAPETVCKCSYASSLGVNEISDADKTIYRKYLLRFDKISVRENSGANILSKCLNRNIYVVPDPVFLLTQSEWKMLISKVNLHFTKPYVLIYFIGENKDNWKRAIKFAEYKRLDIKVIPSLESHYIPENLDVVKNIGPLEFLSYIDNASFFCTDSFHGTAFSLLLNTNFFSFKRFKDDERVSQNVRIEELLKGFDLVNNIVCYDINTNTDDINIDWGRINSQLQAYRNVGIQYLKEII